jgi:protein-disulfide isomerase
VTGLLYDRPLLTVPVGEGDHLLGPRTASLTLVEYGDYECPFCGDAYPVVEEVRGLLRDELLFAYRHFPLTQIHPHAALAAEAAEAADAQGLFWEMHGRLFLHQDRLAPADLVEHARVLGLDLARFERDLATREYGPKVRAQFLSGVRSGVNGTPTFFVNGVRHNGGYDLASLLDALREP